MKYFKGAIRSLALSFMAWFPPRNAAVVLMYHSVGDNGVFFTVTPQMFERQMQYLKEHDFIVVSLERLTEYRRTGSIPPKTVAITFDDGYRDNYLEALPVLKRYGFPATLFLATANVGGSRTVRGAVLPMADERELREMEAADFTLEAHTATHPKLPSLSAAAAQEETMRSKCEVERIAGKESRYFAYPYGRFNDTIVEAVRKAGFFAAYTTREGLVRPESDDWRLARNSIDAGVSFFDFKRIVRVGRVSLSRLRLLA